MRNLHKYVVRKDKERQYFYETACNGNILIRNPMSERRGTHVFHNLGTHFCTSTKELVYVKYVYSSYRMERSTYYLIALDNILTLEAYFYDNKKMCDNRHKYHIFI